MKANYGVEFRQGIPSNYVVVEEEGEDASRSRPHTLLILDDLMSTSK